MVLVLQDQEENSELPWEGSTSSETSLPSSRHDNKRRTLSADIPVRPRLKIPETQFPASVSIDTLLGAGKISATNIH